MKRNNFTIREAGRQAAMFDWSTYGKEMPEKYEDWNEDYPFEQGYMEYINERLEQ